MYKSFRGVFNIANFLLKPSGAEKALNILGDADDVTIPIDFNPFHNSKSARSAGTGRCMYRRVSARP